MCEYVIKNQCKATNSVCPYMTYCNKIQDYKPSKFMPDNCPQKVKAETPKGYNRVIQERKGKLYIEIDEQAIVVANPFDHVPLYVKVTKLKNGNYKLRE